MSSRSKSENQNSLSAAKRKLLDDDVNFSYKSTETLKGYVYDDRDEGSSSTKSKKKKKEKKSKKKKSKKKRTRSSSESSSSSEGDAWVEKSVKIPVEVEKPKEQNRDDWMNMTGAFATYTRKDLQPEEPKETKTKGQIDAYNPSLCSRELNPYWKDGGTGLPSENKPSLAKSGNQQSFSHTRDDKMKKPEYDDDDHSRRHNDDRRTQFKNHSESRSGGNNDDRRVTKFKRPDYGDDDGRSDEHKHSRSRYESDSRTSAQFKRPVYDDDDRDIVRKNRQDDNCRSSHFKKSDYDDDSRSRQDDRREKQSERDDRSHYREPARNWRKNTDIRNKSPESSRSKSPKPSSNKSPQPSRNKPGSPLRTDNTDGRRDRNKSSEEYGASSSRESPTCEDTNAENESQDHADYLTDQQMNAIGAKLVKAEIMGNYKVIASLTAKLEAARIYKKLHPEGPPGGQKEEEEGVILTMTDERGNTRPLVRAQQAGDPRSKGGKKKATTHAEGERLKFFADDDKHTLKEMFEKEKFGTADDDQREFANILAKHKNPNDDLEDIFAESITKNHSDAKRDQQNLNKAISQHKSVQRTLGSCEYCINSDKMIKHMIVSLGNKAYVALPTKKSLTEGHCFISTVGHVACSTIVDEDVWTEIMSYRRALTNMFNARDEDVVFFETVVYFHKLPHLVIQCVPLPRDVGDTAPIYFKKALLECEAEWSNNKKVVDLRGKDVRRGVPKGLPYFWIDFGMDAGFAHVIEDQQLFPMNFAQEIVGGMLDLDHSLWRKPQRENFAAQTKKVLQFTEEWKKFDPEIASS